MHSRPSPDQTKVLTSTLIATRKRKNHTNQYLTNDSVSTEKRTRSHSFQPNGEMATSEQPDASVACDTCDTSSSSSSSHSNNSAGAAAAATRSAIDEIRFSSREEKRQHIHLLSNLFADILEKIENDEVPFSLSPEENLTLIANLEKIETLKGYKEVPKEKSRVRKKFFTLSEALSTFTKKFGFDTINCDTSKLLKETLLEVIESVANLDNTDEDVIEFFKRSEYFSKIENLLPKSLAHKSGKRYHLFDLISRVNTKFKAVESSASVLVDSAINDEEGTSDTISSSSSTETSRLQNLVESQSSPKNTSNNNAPRNKTRRNFDKILTVDIDKNFINISIRRAFSRRLMRLTFNLIFIFEAIRNNIPQMDFPSKQKLLDHLTRLIEALENNSIQFDATTQATAQKNLKTMMDIINNEKFINDRLKLFTNNPKKIIDFLQSQLADQKYRKIAMEFFFRRDYFKKSFTACNSMISQREKECYDLKNLIVEIISDLKIALDKTVTRSANNTLLTASTDISCSAADSSTSVNSSTGNTMHVSNLTHKISNATSANSNLVGSVLPANNGSCAPLRMLGNGEMVSDADLLTDGCDDKASFLSSSSSFGAVLTDSRSDDLSQSYFPSSNVNAISQDNDDSLFGFDTALECDSNNIASSTPLTTTEQASEEPEEGSLQDNGQVLTTPQSSHSSTSSSNNSSSSHAFEATTVVTRISASSSTQSTNMHFPAEKAIGLVNEEVEQFQNFVKFQPSNPKNTSIDNKTSTGRQSFGETLTEDMDETFKSCENRRKFGSRLLRLTFNLIFIFEATKKNIPQMNLLSKIELLNLLTNLIDVLENPSAQVGATTKITAQKNLNGIMDILNNKQFLFLFKNNPKMVVDFLRSQLENKAYREMAMEFFFRPDFFNKNYAHRNTKVIARDGQPYDLKKLINAIITDLKVNLESAQEIQANKAMLANSVTDCAADSISSSSAANTNTAPIIVTVWNMGKNATIIQSAPQPSDQADETASLPKLSQSQVMPLQHFGLFSQATANQQADDAPIREGSPERRLQNIS